MLKPLLYATYLTLHLLPPTTLATQVWVGSGSISNKDAMSTCESWQEFSCINDICDPCAGASTSGRCRNGGNTKGTCAAGTLCASPKAGKCLENTICAPGKHSMPDKSVGTPKHFKCLHVEQIETCKPVIAYENHDCTGNSCFIAANGHFETNGGKMWNCIDTDPQGEINTGPCRSAGEATGQGSMPPQGGGWPLGVPVAVGGPAGVPGQGCPAAGSSGGASGVPSSSIGSGSLLSSSSSLLSTSATGSVSLVPFGLSTSSPPTSASALTSTSSSTFSTSSSTPTSSQTPTSIPRHMPIPSFGTSSSFAGTGIWPSSAGGGIPIHGPYIPTSVASYGEDPYQTSSTSSSSTTCSSTTTSAAYIAPSQKPYGYLPPKSLSTTSKPHHQASSTKNHHHSSSAKVEDPYGYVPAKSSSKHTATSSKHHPKHPHHHHSTTKKEHIVTVTTTEIDKVTEPCPSSSKH